MSTLSSSCAAALFAVLAQGVSAQSTPTAPLDHGAAIAGSFGLQVDGDEVIGGGRSYFARFETGSVEVTPALGDAAPHNMPVRFTLESIVRGSTVVCEGGLDEPRVEGDSRVVYRRSSSIVERYDVRADGVEQSFVFDERLPGRGDLVVRLRVDSELRGEAGAHPDGFELTLPGMGGVSVGGVTGIDAGGNTSAGSMRFDGDCLELVLPHSFVQDAAYPLVLDPLIGGITSAGASFDDYEPDMAYNATHDVYIVVWEFRSSATQTQVWGQGLNGDGSRRGGIVFIARGSSMQKNPTIANVAVSDQFTVAWQDDQAGNFDIVSCSVAALDGQVSPFTIVASTANDEITPDAGGDSTGPDDEAILVWHEVGRGIQAVELEAKAGQAPTVAGSVVNIDPSSQAKHPAISKTGGAGNRYLVVWETATSNDFLIGYAAYDRNLTLLSAPSSQSGQGRPVVHPDVDGDGSRWMLVYQQMESASSSSGDVRFVETEFDLTNGFRVLTSGAIVDTPSIDEAEPDVVFAGTLYIVAWSEQQATPTEYRIGLTQMIQGGGVPCGLRYVTGRGSGTANTRPVICSQFTGGGTEDLAMLCWELGDLNNGNSLVMRQRFDSFGGGAITTIGPGCQGGGTAATDGPLAIGNPRFALTLSGVAANATAAVAAVGARGAPPTTCGACTLIDAIATASAPVNGGNAQFSLPVPCNPNLIGVSLAAQWWVLSPGASDCPLLPGVGASNILGMTIAD